MYRAAIKNSKRTRRHSVSASYPEILFDMSSNPEMSHHQHVFRNKVKLTRKRSSTTSISLFFREEGRAAKTGAIVISSFIMSWMPYFAYNLFESIFCYSPVFENATVLLALSSSCTMPFIYVYRNDKARTEAIKVICWWRSNQSPVNSYHRSSQQCSADANHIHPPVTVLESSTGKLYTYASECDSCRLNHFDNSMKNYRPMAMPVQESRRNSILKHECSVSFNLPPNNHLPRYSNYLGDYPACSNETIMSEKSKFVKNFSNQRWMNHRMSIASTAGRSDSLVSTSSSVLSYGTQKRQRRLSNYSCESVKNFTKRTTGKYENNVTCPRAYQNQRQLSGEDENQDLNELEFHIYSNPYRPNYIYRHEQNFSSPTRFIWEVDEADSSYDDVMENNFHIHDLVATKTLQHAKEMEDLQSMQHNKQRQMFHKRLSERELKLHSTVGKGLLVPHNLANNSTHSMTDTVKQTSKYSNREKSGMALKSIPRNILLDQLFVHSSNSSVKSCDDNLLRTNHLIS